MEARMTGLENELNNIKLTMAESQKKTEACLERIIAVLNREDRGKSTTEDEGDGSTLHNQRQPRREDSPRASGSFKKLQGEALDEFRQSVKKIELPMFDGNDPAGWISRVEVYFRVQDTKPEVRMNLAQLCMEGSTIHFFNSLLDEDEEMSWEQLKRELMDRYGGMGEGDIFEQLTSLRQKGSVEEYIERFELLTAQVRKLPEEQFFGYFIHGLKENIRGRVRSMKALGPISRSRLMNLVRAIEMELLGGRIGWSSGGRRDNRAEFGLQSVNRPNSSLTHKNRLGSDWVHI